MTATANNSYIQAHIKGEGCNGWCSTWPHSFHRPTTVGSVKKFQAH